MFFCYLCSSSVLLLILVILHTCSCVLLLLLFFSRSPTHCYHGSYLFLCYFVPSVLLSFSIVIAITFMPILAFLCSSVLHSYPLLTIPLLVCLFYFLVISVLLFPYSFLPVFYACFCVLFLPLFVTHCTHPLCSSVLHLLFSYACSIVLSPSLFSSRSLIHSFSMPVLVPLLLIVIPHSFTHTNHPLYSFLIPLFPLSFSISVPPCLYHRHFSAANTYP